MSELSKRFVGERSVNWPAMIVVVLVVGSTVGGLGWFYKRQIGRQTDALRAQIERAERGEGNENLDDLYATFLRFAPHDAAVLAKYGTRLAKKAESDREKVQAINILDRAVRENPNDVGLRQELVELALEPGFDSDCNPDPHLQILIDKLPKSAVPCEQLAGRMEANGDYPKAESLLKEGIKREENRASTRIKLARLLHFRLRREDDAKRVLGDLAAPGGAPVKKLDVGAFSAADRLALAAYYQDVGERSRARALVEDALKAYPDDPDVLLAAAQKCEDRAADAAEKDRASILNEAVAHLKKCRSIAPAKSESYLRLSVVFNKMQRPEESLAALEEGLKAIPSSFDLRWAKCEALLSKNDAAALAQAEKVVEDIRSLEPRPELIQFLEARLNVARRQWIDAAQGLEKSIPALARIPRATRQGLLMLGAVYREIGEPVLRESAYRRLLANEPLNLDAILGLGESLADQKRYVEAVEHLGRIASQTMPPQDKARLQGTLLVALVGRELEKPASKRSWEPIDRVLDDVEKAGKEANQLQWLRLASEIRVGRLAAEEQFDDGLRVVDRFLALAPTLKESAEDTTEVRRSALAAGYKNKIQLLLFKKDVAKAREVLAESKSKTGDTVASRLAEALIECATGRPKNPENLDRLAAGDDKFEVRDRLLLLRSLGEIRQQVGDEKGALSLFNRASAIAPQDQSIQRTRFLLAFDSANFEQAKAAASAMAASNAAPGSSAACAQALLALDDYERHPNPNELRKQAVNLQGSEPLYRTWSGAPRALGRIAELEGRFKDSISHYRAAFDPKAPSRRIARRLLQLNNQVQDYAEARKWIRYSDVDQSEPGLARIAAEVSLRAGDFESARKLVALAAPPNTSNPDLALWGGIILQTAKAPIEAEKMFRRAVEIAPGHPRPLAALVEMLVRQNRKADARRELEAAYKSVPPASLPLVKARGEEAFGDLEAADRALEDSLKTPNPGVAVLRYATEHYLRRLNLTKALNTANRLQKEPSASPADRGWAARMKGLALVASGKTEEARRSISEIGGSESGGEGDFRYDVRTKALILSLQPNTESWRSALAELKKLAQLQAEELTDHLIAAQIQINLGDWGAAKSRLLSVIQSLKRDDPRILVLLVRGMLANNEPVVEVGPWLDRLERVGRGEFDSLLLRAQWRQRKDRSAPAYVEELTKSGKADDWTAGMILAELRDPAAEVYLAKATGDLSKNPTPKQIAAALQLARSQSRNAKIRDALATCDSLKAHLSPTGYAQAYLGVLFMTADDPPKDRIDAFRNWLNERVKENPKNYSFRLAAAGLESRLGRQDKALRLLNALKAEMPSTDPTFPAVVNNLAFLTALAEKKPDEAERLLSEHISAFPTEMELRDTLGVVQLEQGNVEKALDAFKELSMVTPKGVVYFHLARAQALKGDVKSARSALEKAKSLKFRSEELHQLERPQYSQLVAKLAKSDAK